MESGDDAAVAAPAAAAAGVRDTPEYAAAWQLEVWKEQQRRRFTRALSEERAAMVKELQEGAEADTRRRNAEFRARHDQVEKLAERVARSLEWIRKREERAQNQERELARRRSELGRDWERKQQECEERVRRATEKEYFNAQGSQTRVKELEEMNEALRRKCSRLQEEYDKLCSEFTSWRKEHLTARPAADDDVQAKLRQEREARAKAEAERDAAAEKLVKSRGTVRRLRRQLTAAAEEHNRLLRHSYAEQLANIDRERAALQRAQALQAAAEVRTERQKASVVTAPAPCAAGTPQQPAAEQPHAAAAAELRELIAQVEARVKVTPSPVPSDSASPPRNRGKQRAQQPRPQNRRTSPRRQPVRPEPRPLPAGIPTPDVGQAVARRLAEMAAVREERQKAAGSSSDSGSSVGQRSLSDDGSASPAHDERFNALREAIRDRHRHFFE
eukprot:TRINITY_DN13157_c1_g1_i1.p1 TRINITY_DN13157_c1_g1~~TRINITY_DN13157_c1_g1_i1.p1  ORF type:complete len:445 (+),score=159.19 TRINITY_DN13157_c1_g1_i1:51-1385(+)